jgi:hypothetical protein
MTGVRREQTSLKKKKTKKPLWQAGLQVGLEG